MKDSEPVALSLKEESPILSPGAFERAPSVEKLESFSKLVQPVEAEPDSKLVEQQGVPE